MNLICQLVLTFALVLGGNAVTPRAIDGAATAQAATAVAAVQTVLDDCCEPCSAICRWICEALGCGAAPCEGPSEKPETCCPPSPCAPRAPPGCCTAGC